MEHGLKRRDVKWEAKSQKSKRQNDGWEEIEKQKFLQAVRQFGKNWKKVQEFIETKSKP